MGGQVNAAWLATVEEGDAVICDLCAKRTCTDRARDDYPSSCPTRSDAQQDVLSGLSPEDQRIADAANRALAFEGPRRTRAEEVMAFARTLGARTVGVAFCSSLAFEARIFCAVLRDNGFTVESVICKNGSHGPDDLGVASPKPAGEGCVVCNPIVQAGLLNEAGTDLNVIMGLCPGHDSLFIKHSEAPVTVMAVRDFVAGHNPLAPLYQHEALYARIHHAALPPFA